MKIILLEKVAGLGELGDINNVRAGYARNFLFPQGKAERADKHSIAAFESRRADLEKRQLALLSAVERASKTMEGYLLQMSARAGPDGNLYGSITPAAICTALNAQKIVGDIDLKRGQIALSAGNLKEVGEHEVKIIFAPGMEAKITVSVLADNDSSGTVAGDKNKKENE